MAKPKKRQLKRNKNNLTPGQQAFCDEWLIDGNGTRAYRAAYPDCKTEGSAKAGAARLLTNVNVKAYLERRQAELAFKTEVTQERIKKEEACLAYSNAFDLFDEATLISVFGRTDIPEGLQRAVSSLKIREDVAGQRTVEIKLWDKGSALGRLERSLGMYEKDNEQAGKAAMMEILKVLSATAPALAEAIKEKLSAAANSK